MGLEYMSLPRNIAVSVVLPWSLSPSLSLHECMSLHPVVYFTLDHHPQCLVCSVDPFLPLFLAFGLNEELGSSNDKGLRTRQQQ